MQKYYLIQWPESQEIMEADFFEDAFLCGEEKFHASYFVEVETYDEWINNKI